MWVGMWHGISRNYFDAVVNGRRKSAFFGKTVEIFFFLGGVFQKTAKIQIEILLCTPAVPSYESASEQSKILCSIHAGLTIPMPYTSPPPPPSLTYLSWMHLLGTVPSDMFCPFQFSPRVANQVNQAVSLTMFRVVS